jgi:type IV secretory pathway TrbD component
MDSAISTLIDTMASTVVTVLSGFVTNHWELLVSIALFIVAMAYLRKLARGGAV